MDEVPDIAGPPAVNGTDGPPADGPPAPSDLDEAARDRTFVDALFAAAPIGLAFVDRSYRYVRVNPATAARLGTVPEEVNGRRLADLDPELWSTLRPVYERVVQTGRAVDVEGARTDDGVLQCRLLRYYPVRAGEELIGFGLLDLDITRRKRAELAAAELAEERRDLVDALMRAHERERQRIAADIHGDTLQVFAALRLKLEELDGSLHEPGQRAVLAEFQDAFVAATRRLRGMLFELWPPSLERVGLPETVAELLDQVERDTGLKTRLEVGLSRELSLELRGVMYRVIAEAVTNVRRHAGATTIEVALDGHEDSAIARVHDDGHGFDPATARIGHVGLREMAERAHAVGGTVVIASIPGTGTTVELCVPAGAG